MRHYPHPSDILTLGEEGLTPGFDGTKLENTGCKYSTFN